MAEQIALALSRIRKTKPLILNLTNYVTMDLMANALLAVGAAPVMSVAEEELNELMQLAASININIGTLDEVFIRRCHSAVSLAGQHKKTVILDPVGAGASIIRTRTAQVLMQHADIVKGNASEIISLQEKGNRTRGVESTNTTAEAREIAMGLSKKYGFTTVVTGPVDFITDGKREAEVPFGSALMPLVTGMGCTLAAVIAAFTSVSDDSFDNACLATRYFALCGQAAEKNAPYPGSFRTAFLDALYAADTGEC